MLSLGYVENQNKQIPALKKIISPKLPVHLLSYVRFEWNYSHFLTNKISFFAILSVYPRGKQQNNF